VAFEQPSQVSENCINAWHFSTIALATLLTLPHAITAPPLTRPLLYASCPSSQLSAFNIQNSWSHMQMFGKCQTSVEGASNAEKRKELHSEKFIVQNIC